MIEFKEMQSTTITKLIRSKIIELGFQDFKIIRPKIVEDKHANHLYEWLKDGHEADMHYMRTNIEKRINPSLLVENAKSILVFAYNYYPSTLQPIDHPQIAYYAYGEDYHEVIKDKLKILYSYILTLNPSTNGRCFCDTAPVLERYWAQESKLGWIGKNSMLIIPQKGSYFFLATMILDIELEYDEESTTKMPSCVSCTKCIDACPTNAIIAPYQIDANKCISYQTIENKTESIPQSIAENLNNQIYGCDICQQVCPWNRFASPTTERKFDAKKELLSLDLEQFYNLSVEDYTRIFKNSPMKRAKLSGIIRNALYLQKLKKKLK